METLNEITKNIKEIIKDECLAIENKYQKQIAKEKEPFLREILNGLNYEPMKTYTATDILNILERLQDLYQEDDYLE